MFVSKTTTKKQTQFQIMSIQRTQTKRRPNHPGLFIDEFILKELSIPQQQLAQALGVSRRTINQLVRGKRKISLDIALRLSRFTMTTPELWLNMQRAVDLWDARNEKNESIEAIKPCEYFGQTV